MLSSRQRLSGNSVPHPSLPKHCEDKPGRGHQFESDSECSTVLHSTPTSASPRVTQSAYHHDEGDDTPVASGARDGSPLVAETQRGDLVAGAAKSPRPGLPVAAQDVKPRVGVPRLSLSSLGACSERGAHGGVPRLQLPGLGSCPASQTTRESRGQHSPDPQRHRRSARASTTAGTDAGLIQVFSLTGDLLCTLHGSAKLLTLDELKFLIKEHTDIFVDYQELVHGHVILSDLDARPFEHVEGPLSLTLVQRQPLPTFRAPI